MSVSVSVHEGEMRGNEGGNEGKGNEGGKMREMSQQREAPETRYGCTTVTLLNVNVDVNVNVNVNEDGHRHRTRNGVGRKRTDRYSLYG